MFKFPAEFEASFLDAWKEPFTGFELKWIEVEICRQAVQETNVTDLFEKLKSDFPDIEDMHQSKFYRIVNSLESAGYLEAKSQGRAKMIHTTNAGAKELGRITRYFFEIQMERMKAAIWQDLVDKISSPLGCLLEREMLVIGPEYNTINTLIYASLSTEFCSTNHSSDKATELQKNFVFLNYDAVLQGRSEHSRMASIDDISNWPYKEGYIDIAILFNTLSAFPREAVEILKEAKRVVGPSGQIILFELTHKDSKLFTMLLRESAMLMNFSNPSTKWKLAEELPDDNQLHEWIKKASLEIIHEFPDLISSIFLLQ